MEREEFWPSRAATLADYRESISDDGRPKEVDWSNCPLAAYAAALPRIHQNKMPADFRAQGRKMSWRISDMQPDEREAHHGRRFKTSMQRKYTGAVAKYRKI